MQQAITNSIRIQTTNKATKTGRAGNANAPKAAGLVRWAAARWELVGVLTLMGSSAAYGAFALAHVGL